MQLCLGAVISGETGHTHTLLLLLYLSRFSSLPLFSSQPVVWPAKQQVGMDMLQIAVGAEKPALDNLRQTYPILRWDESFMKMI